MPVLNTTPSNVKAKGRQVNVQNCSYGQARLVLNPVENMVAISETEIGTFVNIVTNPMEYDNLVNEFKSKPDKLTFWGVRSKFL